MGYGQQPYQQQQQYQQQGYQQQQYQQPAAAAAPGGATWSQQLFKGNHFTIKQKKLSLGNKYYVEDSTGKTVAFIHQKLLKLKEDIRIFTDETMTHEIMKISQEQILDFSGSYQVMDSMSGQLLGILKRKGLKSMFKDEWQILNTQRQEVGLIKERGGFMWFLRRFIFKWIPYKYDILLHENPVGEITEKMQIIGDTYTLDLSKDPNVTLDRRLAVVCCVMMDIGEHE
jgi:uncharacterized protein YxjI